MIRKLFLYFICYKLLSKHLLYLLWGVHNGALKFRLCIEPRIQEQRMECGNVANGGCYIEGNVSKYFGESQQKLRGISPNILEKVLKHFGECKPNKINKIIRGISPNIPENVN